jgi:hypothetical protein
LNLNIIESLSEDDGNSEDPKINTKLSSTASDDHQSQGGNADKSQRLNARINSLDLSSNESSGNTKINSGELSPDQ